MEEWLERELESCTLEEQIETLKELYLRQKERGDYWKKLFLACHNEKS